MFPRNFVILQQIRNFMKQAKNIEEQIALLRQRGMHISDIEKAKENLLDIGYYRLGFYSFPFEKSYPKWEKRTHEYKEGTEFEDIIKLYYFDVDVRNLLAKYIYRFEINFRTYLTYTVSNHYKNKPTWFVHPEAVTQTFIQQFDKLIYNENFRTIVPIKHHHKNHINDKYAPAWKTIEFMTFGAVIRLYRHLKDKKLKLAIAKYYGFKSIKTFENYLETARTIRNVCAHNAVAYDIRTSFAIAKGPASCELEHNHDLSGIISVVRYLLGCVSRNRQAELDMQINELLQCENYPENVRKVIENCSGLKFS